MSQLVMMVEYQSQFIETIKGNVMIEIECGIKAPIVGEANQAIRWFKTNGVHAWEDDGSVYVEFEDAELEIQVSSAEVSYRSELYKEECGCYD